MLGSQVTAKGSWSRHRGHWRHTLDAAAGPAEGMLICPCVCVSPVLVCPGPTYGASQIFIWPFKILIEGEAQSLARMHTMTLFSNMAGSSHSQWFPSMATSIKQGQVLLGVLNETKYDSAILKNFPKWQKDGMSPSQEVHPGA